MMKKVIFGLAVLFTGLFIGTTAVADSWKDESGKGKGHYKHEWKEHGGGETPGWARGKGYWDGDFKHGRSRERYRRDQGHYDGGHQYRSDYGHRSYGSYPHHQGYSPSYRVPYGYPQSAPYCYGPAPYGQGWNFEGSLRVYPQPGW